MLHFSFIQNVIVSIYLSINAYIALILLAASQQKSNYDQNIKRLSSRKWYKCYKTVTTSKSNVNAAHPSVFSLQPHRNTNQFHHSEIIIKKSTETETNTHARTSCMNRRNFLFNKSKGSAMWKR